VTMIMIAIFLLFCAIPTDWE